MKQTIYCILLILLFAEATTGQVSSPELPAVYARPRFFLLAGPSLVFVHGNEPYKQYGVAKVGFSAGVGINKRIASCLQIQGKVMYERKGYKTSQADTAYTGSVWATGKLINNRTYDYLTFSVTPQILLGRRKAFSLGVGGYYGQLLNAKWQIIVTELGLNSSSRITTGRPKDDYGLIFNLGYTLVFNKKVLIDLQLSENYGLMQLTKQLPPVVPREKNNSVVLMVAIGKR